MKKREVNEISWDIKRQITGLKDDDDIPMEKRGEYLADIMEYIHKKWNSYAKKKIRRSK